MKLAGANADSNLFCKLYIACESRKGDIDEFFNHENNRNPPSISEFGKLRQLSGDSDDIIKCLYPSNTLENLASNVEINATVLVLNASSLALDLAPKNMMTVKEYSDTVFNKFIDSKSEIYSRIDIVFEYNQENSLIKLAQGCSVPTKYLNLIDNDTKLPNKKKNYANLVNNMNTRSQFLKLLESNLIETLSIKDNKRYYSARDSIVISNKDILDIRSISTFREDTNARLLLHAENAVFQGHENIKIHTNDFNVVVVALYAFKYLQPNISKMWIEVNNDGRKYTAAIHDLYQMNSDVSDLLPFIHSLTGNYPTTSGFNGIGKKTAWNTWKKFRDVDSAILGLMNNNSPSWCEKSMNVLERFIILMYDSKSRDTSLGECRRVLFTLRNKPFDRIPPTRDTLELHVKRAILQASLWTQCLQRNNTILDPTDWGWIATSTGQYSPKWTTVPILAEHCQELITCGCKGKCTRCKCAKKSLPCTKLCTCNCEITKKMA